MADLTAGKVKYEVEVDNSGLKSGLDEAKGKFSDAGGAAEGFGGVLKGVLTAGFITAGFAAIKSGFEQVIATGKEFETSMSQVKATMGDAAGEMITYKGQSVTAFEAIEDKAKELGATTQFTAKQAADGFNILAMAGMDANTAIEVLPSTLDLAAAGAIDIAEAADYTTGIMAGFGLETEQAGEVADYLTKMSTSAKGSVAQFGQALAKSAGMAKTTGQNMKTTSVALEILGNHNLSAAEAGNALNRTLKNLYQPTEVAKNAMKQLGVTAYDAQGKALPLDDVLRQLNGTLDGMSEEAKNDILSQIFDAATLKSVPFLIEDVTTSWDDLATGLENSTGAAARAAETQLDNLEGAITLFDSAMDGFKIAVYDKISEPLKDIVKEGAEAVSGLTDAFKDDGLLGAIGFIGETAVEKFTEFGKSILGIKDPIGEAQQAVIDLKTANDEAVESIEAQTRQQEYLVDKIERVNEVEELSKAQKELLKQYVDELNTSLGYEAATIDAETGHIVENTDAIRDGITAREEELKSYLYREQAKAVTEELIRTEMALFDAQVDLEDTTIDLENAEEALRQKKAELEKQYEGNANATEIIKDLTMEEAKEVSDLRQKRSELIATIQDNQAALQDLQEEERRQNNMADITSGLLDDLLNQLGMTADELAPTLKNGLEQGRYMIPQTVEELNALIKFDESVENADKQGKEIAEELRQSIWDGEVSVTQAAEFMANGINGAFADSPDESWDIGWNIAMGVANGISSGQSSIVNSAASAVRSAIWAAKAEAGIASPSKVFKYFGKMMDAGLAEGLTENIDRYIIPAVSEVNDNLNMTANMTGGVSRATGNGGDGIAQLFAQLFQILENRDTKIVLDSGELVGALSPLMDEALWRISVRKGRG